MYKARLAAALMMALALPAQGHAGDASPALLKAAAQCNAAAAAAELRAGADPNAAGTNGASSLSLAVTRALTLNEAPSGGDDPCLETVQTLLDAGGDPTLPGRTGDKSPLLHTALTVATLYQHYAAFALLAQKAKPVMNELVGEFGETPLIVAIRYRDPALVRILLQYGADPNHKDARGQTPMDVARGPVDNERMKVLATMGIARNEAQDKAIIKLLEISSW